MAPRKATGTAVAPEPAPPSPAPEEVTKPDEGEVTEPDGTEPTPPESGDAPAPDSAEPSDPEGDPSGDAAQKPETTEELLARLTSVEADPVDVTPTTVIMQVAISGTRDGEKWPGVGGEVELPADEADRMVALGYARLPD